MSLLRLLRLTELQPGSNKLRLRLLGLLALGLSPILLFSAGQAAIDAQQFKKDQRNELIVRSENAFARVQASLARTSVLLELFADDIQAGHCSQVHKQAESAQFLLTNVIMLDANNNPQCSATGYVDEKIQAIVTNDFIDGTTEQLRASPAYFEDTGHWNMPIATRLTDIDGSYEGAAIFTIDITRLATLISQETLQGDTEFALADNLGRIINSDLSEALTPEQVLETADEEGGVLLTVRTDRNKYSDVVIRELFGDELFSVIARSSPSVFQRLTAAPARSFGIPFITFALALFIVWIAVDNLVLRWLPSLSARAKAYGRGNYRLAPDESFKEAPTEFAELEKTLSNMAARIAERDISLNEAVTARDAALKEVHHRVRNNLQIVTSLLRLETYEITDEAAVEALGSTRNRIDALSLVHETLYKETRVQSVPARPLVRSLVGHLETSLFNDCEDIFLKADNDDIDDIDLSADDAIPMALLIVEIVADAVHRTENRVSGIITISLQRQSDSVDLLVADSGDPGTDADDEANRLSSRLVGAFVRQLRATLETHSDAKSGRVTKISIPRQSREMKEPVF